MCTHRHVMAVNANTLTHTQRDSKGKHMLLCIRTKINGKKIQIGNACLMCSLTRRFQWWWGKNIHSRGQKKAHYTKNAIPKCVDIHPWMSYSPLRTHSHKKSPQNSKTETKVHRANGNFCRTMSYVKLKIREFYASARGNISTFYCMQISANEQRRWIDGKYFARAIRIQLTLATRACESSKRKGG